MNFLDIIVPQYKENEDIIKNLLDSIINQKRIKFDDIGIIIINDASDVILNDSFLKKYKVLNIKYIKNEINVGPGVTRANALRISKAKYVTFVDSDDVLFNDSLYEVINTLKQTNPNILCTSMIQERLYNGQIIQSKVGFNELRTLHGVFIKRRYINDNEINFHKELRYFEDTYFITLLASRNDFQLSNITSYIWKYNECSLTQKKDKYDVSVKHFRDMFICHRDVYEYFVKYDIKNKEIYLMQQLVELASILSSSFFSFDELKKEKEEYEKLVHQLYLDNIDDINKIDLNMQKRIIDYQIKSIKSYYNGIIIYNTFDDFINKMKKES